MCLPEPKKKKKRLILKKAICLAARITGEAAVCCAAGAGLPGGKLELLCPCSGQIPAGIPGGLRDGVCAENGSLFQGTECPGLGSASPVLFILIPWGQSCVGGFVSLLWVLGA